VDLFLWINKNTHSNTVKPLISLPSINVNLFVVRFFLIHIFFLLFLCKCQPPISGNFPTSVVFLCQKNMFSSNGCSWSYFTKQRCIHTIKTKQNISCLGIVQCFPFIVSPFKDNCLILCHIIYININNISWISWHRLLVSWGLNKYSWLAEEHLTTYITTIWENRLNSTLPLPIHTLQYWIKLEESNKERTLYQHQL